MLTPPTSRSPSFFNVVAAFAPARQIGYVGSRERRPPSPKILRPRTDGAEYCTDTDLPPRVAVAREGGLCCATSVAEAATAARATIICRRIFLQGTGCCRRHTRTARS